jgi:hypothetical protein
MAEYNSSYTGAQIDSAVSKAHSHTGNITESGTLQTTDITIGDGDKLVVTDASDNNKVARASVYFNGSTTTKALTQKGTFETFARPSDLPTTMVASGTGHAGGLVPDPPETAGTLKYLREDGTWAEPDGGADGAFLKNATGLAATASFDPQTDTVWNKQQTLTSVQKAQVKTNLDIQDIVFNTAYDATTNKAATMADIPASLPANGGNSATVNNHMVQSDVPANAVFTDTTYSAATQSDAGLMSAADKKKVDNVMALENSATTTGSLALTPNILYSLGALTGALTVTLGSVVSGIPNTYMMEFDINDDAATPTKVPSFPASIVWREEPVWTTGKHYEISIRYSANTQTYYAMYVEFDTAS